MRLFYIILLAGISIAVSGCAALLGEKTPDYRTIEASPYHDTESAKSKNEKGVQLIEKGKLDQAEKLLQEALVCDVTYGPAHNNLGQLYFQQGKLYLAAWEFEYAKQLMSERPEPYNNLGLVYESVDRLEQAVDMFSTAFSLAPSNAEYIGNLARTRLRRGDRDDETVYLLEQLRIYDTRPEWIDWANYELSVGPISSLPPVGETAIPDSPPESKSEPMELLPPSHLRPANEKRPIPAAPNLNPERPATANPDSKVSISILD